MIAPSRKIIAIAIVCSALVISVAYVQFKKQQTVSDEYNNQAVLTTVELPEVSVPIYAKEDTTDTDGDGLKDWQEVIQGTDVYLVDTDSDGTRDGAEIDQGRNPLVPGPDDKGASIETLKIGSNDIYSEYVPRSLTDTLSKDLFSAYIQVKSEGEADNSQTLSDVANTLAQEALSKNELVEKYNTTSIGTFDDRDAVLGEAYGEQFAEIYITMLKTIEQGPNDLKIIAAEYQNFSKKITAIYVPESLQQTHADLGNNFYSIALMFSIIAEHEKDPIRTALALRNMKQLLTEQSQMFISIANYFRRNGILFENQDTQRLWENI